MKKKKLAFLLAAVLIFSVLLTACGNNNGEDAAETEPPEVTQTPSPEPVATPTPEPAYLDRFIFVGDANTYGLKYYNMLADGSATHQVWSPTNGTLEMENICDALIYYPDTEEEMTVSQAAELKTPDYILLSIGMVGIENAEEDAFKSEYRSLIKSIQAASPDTVIICNSIYPVEAGYDEKDNGITNTAIDVANIWIAAVAGETGTVYMDTASVLKGADGSLIGVYGTGDGVHIAPAGYTEILKYLNEHPC